MKKENLIKTLLLILSVCLTSFQFSCKKETKNEDSPQINITGTVSIEGREYKTVTIDNLEWTSENYDGKNGVYYNQIVNHSYGKMLTLFETKSIILPQGWRIPTVKDYVDLINKYGGFENYSSTGIIDGKILDKKINTETVKNLLSTNDGSFRGTNKSGFNALPAGLFQPGKNQSFEFEFKGTHTALWTSDIYLVSNVYRPMLLGLGSDGNFAGGSFSESAQPIMKITDDTRGKGSIRFVRNK